MIPLYVPVVKSVILVTSGMLLLRLAGRKSISQMTVGQAIVMISIGSIIIEPIITEMIVNTLVAALTFIITLIATEYLELRFPSVENFLSGKSQVVIENGVINAQNLKRLRLTTDKLEMRLRQQGIASISDVKMATLESNGQLGYELKRSAQPLTVGEFEQALQQIFGQNVPPTPPTHSLFDEVNNEKHAKPVPRKLR